jgi:hypothetical protein
MVLRNVKTVDLPKVEIGLVSEVRIDKVVGDAIEVSFCDPIGPSHSSPVSNKPSVSTMKTSSVIPESGIQLKNLKCGMKLNGTGTDEGGTICITH